MSATRKHCQVCYAREVIDGNLLMKFNVADSQDGETSDKLLIAEAKN